MQQNSGDFKELDVLQAKAHREIRKNFHEAKQKYYKDNTNNHHDNIARKKSQSQYNYFDTEVTQSNYIPTIRDRIESNDQQKVTNKLKSVKQSKQNRNQISNTVIVSRNDKNDKNNKNIKYPQNPYNFTRTIPTNLINNLKDIAQNYYEIKCTEAKNNTDRTKLQKNLRKFEDEYHRKMNYLRSIPARYAQDVQKLRKEIPKGNRQFDALNLLIENYTQEIDNAKIIAGSSMPKCLPAERFTVPQFNKSSSSSVSNYEHPYELTTLAPIKSKNQQNIHQTQSTKKPDITDTKSGRSIRNLVNTSHKQSKPPKAAKSIITENTTARRSFTRFSTGKFATSKSKLTNIIARLRLRARDEFKAKVNAVRDTTRRESDFANHMKLLRDEYYSAIQRINKIPTMNKEFGLKYVQSLQKAQRSLKGKDPELDDLLEYLRKEHQIQNE